MMVENLVYFVMLGNIYFEKLALQTQLCTVTGLVMAIQVIKIMIITIFRTKTFSLLDVRNKMLNFFRSVLSAIIWRK